MNEVEEFEYIRAVVSSVGESVAVRISVVPVHGTRTREYVSFVLLEKKKKKGIGSGFT